MSGLGLIYRHILHAWPLGAEIISVILSDFYDTPMSKLAFGSTRLTGAGYPFGNQQSG